MNFMKSHFWYTKRQRNGILFLTGMLVLMQFILHYTDFTVGDVQQEEDDNFALLQARVDSLKKTVKDSVSWKIYPFNPNFITDFKFPEWTRKKSQAGAPASTQNPTKEKSSAEIKDLNFVTVNELTAIKGVDERMANRIVAYRKKQNGFFDEEQLFEVYYLKKEVGKRILERYKILQQPLIDKTDINTASFKEILKIPYLDYQLTKKIDSFPLDKFDRITVYLSEQ